MKEQIESYTPPSRKIKVKRKVVRELISAQKPIPFALNNKRCYVYLYLAKLGDRRFNQLNIYFFPEMNKFRYEKVYWNRKRTNEDFDFISREEALELLSGKFSEIQHPITKEIIKL